MVPAMPVAVAARSKIARHDTRRRLLNDCSGVCTARETRNLYCDVESESEGVQRPSPLLPQGPDEGQENICNSGLDALLAQWQRVQEVSALIQPHLEREACSKSVSMYGMKRLGGSCPCEDNDVLRSRGRISRSSKNMRSCPFK